MISFDPYSAFSNLGTNSSATDNQAIADNFETFLTLLTTQLQNQSPLDPLDTNQFTQQLVDFAGVEQAVKSNQNLEDLAKLSAANAISGAVSFIGKQVAVSGASSELEDGNASWVYRLNEQANEATITIKDAQGNDVYAETIEAPATEGSFNWNGLKSDGGTAQDGTYTISIDAKNASGRSIEVTTNFAGTVTQVDMENGSPSLTVGGRSIKLENIVKILSEPEQTQQG